MISGTDALIPADTRWRAREACTAAKRALRAGKTAREAVLEHVVPVFAVPGDEPGV